MTQSQTLLREKHAHFSLEGIIQHTKYLFTEIETTEIIGIIFE